MGDRQDILARLQTLLGDRLRLAELEGPLGEETELLGRGIGLDSVETLALVGAIEEEFGLAFDDDELAEDAFRTLGTVVTLVQNGRSG